MINSLYPTFRKWSETGSVWIISDTHFGDPDCNLMSPNWRATPEEHIRILCKYIHKSDTVIHLGDVGENPLMMNMVPGYKVLIMGNHDGTAQKFQWIFNEVYTGPLMIGEKILLSHEPIYGNAWCMNLHGHDHSPLATGDAHHKNFAANVVGYQPISLGKLIKEGLLSPVTSLHRITINNAINNAKKRTIDIYDMDWVHDDITWCASPCTNTDCFRHPTNMRKKTGVHSYADFFGKGECPINEVLYRECFEVDDGK